MDTPESHFDHIKEVWLCIIIHVLCTQWHYQCLCIYLIILLVSNVHILDCEISLNGDSSILLYGTDSIISGISVHDNGCGGIHMSGGDQVCYT